jgi:hypothetical protein
MKLLIEQCQQVEDFAVDLLIYEADIRSIPHPLLGLKAYEMAYNNLLAKGLLKGNALPLEMIFEPGVRTPNLTRTKGTLRMNVPDSRKYPFSEEEFSGEGHDIFHIITSSFANQFAPFSTRSRESKFNTNKHIDIYRDAVKAFNKKFGVNVEKLFAKWVGQPLAPEFKQSWGPNNRTQAYISFANKINRSPEKDIMSLVEKFYESLRRNSQPLKTHYYGRLVPEIKNDGSFNYATSDNLPQYDAEEDIGNVAIFQFIDEDELTPFVEAVRMSRPLSDREKRNMMQILAHKIGTGFSREYTDNPLAMAKTEKLKKFMMEIVPLLMDKYNEYIERLLKMPSVKN